MSYHFRHRLQLDASWFTGYDDEAPDDHTCLFGRPLSIFGRDRAWGPAKGEEEHRAQPLDSINRLAVSGLFGRLIHVPQYEVISRGQGRNSHNGQ